MCKEAIRQTTTEVGLKPPPFYTHTSKLRKKGTTYSSVTKTPQVVALLFTPTTYWNAYTRLGSPWKSPLRVGPIILFTEEEGWGGEISGDTVVMKRPIVPPDLALYLTATHWAKAASIPGYQSFKSFSRFCTFSFSDPPKSCEIPSKVKKTKKTKASYVTSP